MTFPTPSYPPEPREGEARRWHYRRSLASRVTLLTTMAVGIAVAFVALGAYVTVRMQMQSTLDQSLLDRAHKAASSPALSRITADYELPSWALGAADVRIIFINPDRQALSIDSGPTPEGRMPMCPAEGAVGGHHRRPASPSLDRSTSPQPHARPPAGTAMPRHSASLARARNSW